MSVFDDYNLKEISESENENHFIDYKQEQHPDYNCVNNIFSKEKEKAEQIMKRSNSFIFNEILVSKKNN